VAARFLPDLTGLVHDEIHLLVPEQDAESAAVHLEEAMTQSPSWLPTMKLKAEVGVGKNWLAAK
jgi:DNA polymerase I-like protein with 3'-5' exonuclease and polymerase domains